MTVAKAGKKRSGRGWRSSRFARLCRANENFYVHGDALLAAVSTLIDRQLSRALTTKDGIA